MAYCVYQDINLMTNIVVADIANADITSLITEATRQVNDALNILVVREPIDFIDNTRSNDIDGTNKTFYVKNWYGKFLADMNNDGEITKDDVIVYQVASDGTETTPTITSVDDDACSVTLETAPTANNNYYITYSYSPVRQITSYVDPRLKLATVFLTAAFCYAKLNIGCSPSVTFGSTRITKDMDSFSHYYQRYLDIISQINSVEEIHSKVSEDTF